MANIRTLSSKNFSNSSDTRLALSIASTSIVSLAPSRTQLPDGTIKFSRLSLNTVSRFPRDASENFIDQETLIDFQKGLIYGGYRADSSFTPTIPSAGSAVCAAIQLDESDRIKIVYGYIDSETNCKAAASKVDTSGNLVKYDSSCSLIWICVLTSANGVDLSPIASSNLYDMRVFTNLAAPSTKNLQNRHDSGTVGTRHLLVGNAVSNGTELVIPGYTKFAPNESFILRSRTSQTSTSVEQSLIDLNNGSYSIRPVSEGATSKALRKADGTDWALGSDFNYGDDLKTVPAVGNKLYGSSDGITLYNDADGQTGGYEGKELSLIVPDLLFRARNLSSYATYVPLNREVAIDPDAGIIKFGSDIYLGDGRHGNLTLTSFGTYSLNQSISGITYCRSRKVSGFVKKSDRVIPYAGTDISVIAGDVVLVYTAQVANDSSKVGNYSLMKVVSAASNQITVSDNISHNQIGVAFDFDGLNDNVFVMTVPQFNNVTIGSSVTLTCDAYSSTNGFGVLAFMAKGTVSTTGTISVNGKGYKGATVHGGAGQSYLISGYNQVRSTALDSGGAGGVFGTDGVDGSAGQSSGSGSFTAIGGTGGGSGGTGGGAGGGGGYAALGGSGGSGGVSGAGGGGGGATSIATYLPSGTSTNGGTGDSGSGTSSGANGGAAGQGLTAGVTAAGGSGSGLVASQSTGGNGGSTAGSSDIAAPLFGGGGGAAGRGGKGGSGYSAGMISATSAGGPGGGFTEGDTFYSVYATGGGFNNAVYATAVQYDSSYVVGGTFTTLNGNYRSGLARFNPDFTEDTVFNNNLGTGFSSAKVYSITVQNDQLLVGGDFTLLNGSLRNRLVRLNFYGTEDTSFTSNLSGGFNGSVWSTAYQSSDGKILVGGDFTSLSGVTRNRFVRLNFSGTVDTAFYNNLGSGFDSTVRAIDIQSDGKILVGGDFIQLNGVLRVGLVRLNTDGTVDTAFSTAIGTQFYSVKKIKVQSNGKILLSAANAIYRLNSDGTLDNTFSTKFFDAPVRDIAIQSDGGILLGGEFVTISGGTSQNRFLVRLTTNGNLDAAFSSNLGSGFDNILRSVTVLSDGKIIVGGDFNNFKNAAAPYFNRLTSSGLESSSGRVGFVSVGGDGGGLAMILADTVSTLKISANGLNGYFGPSGMLGGRGNKGAVSGTSTPLTGSGIGGHGAGGSSGGGGGGGGGAGGTVLLFVRSVTSISSITATGGSGGAGGAGAVSSPSTLAAINSYASAGGGGAGGASTSGLAGGAGANGRIRMNYFYYSSFYPSAGAGAAALSTSTPAGFLGKISRVDENRYIRGTYNYYDENTDFDTKAELCTATGYTQSQNPPRTTVALKTPLKMTHTCSNAAAIYRAKQAVSVDSILEKYNNRVLFDSGYISVNSGSNATLKHGVSLSLSQLTPLVFVSATNPSNFDNFQMLYNNPFVNNSTVVGVFLNVQDTTVTYTVGQNGLYSSVKDGTSISSGYIRILFVRN